MSSRRAAIWIVGLTALVACSPRDPRMVVAPWSEQQPLKAHSDCEAAALADAPAFGRRLDTLASELESSSDRRALGGRVRLLVIDELLPYRGNRPDRPMVLRALRETAETLSRGDAAPREGVAALRRLAREVPEEMTRSRTHIDQRCAPSWCSEASRSSEGSSSSSTALADDAEVRAAANWIDRTIPRERECSAALTQASRQSETSATRARLEACWNELTDQTRRCVEVLQAHAHDGCSDASLLRELAVVHELLQLTGWVLSKEEAALVRDRLVRDLDRLGPLIAALDDFAKVSAELAALPELPTDGARGKAVERLDDRMRRLGSPCHALAQTSESLRCRVTDCPRYTLRQGSP